MAGPGASLTGITPCPWAPPPWRETPPSGWGHASSLGHRSGCRRVKRQRGTAPGLSLHHTERPARLRLPALSGQAATRSRFLGTRDSVRHRIIVTSRHLQPDTPPVRFNRNRPAHPHCPRDIRPALRHRRRVPAMQACRYRCPAAVRRAIDARRTTRWRTLLRLS